MTTLAQKLPKKISRLEKQFGSDNQFVIMLKRQLADIQASHPSQTETWTTQAKRVPQDTPLDLMNLPFDPAVKAMEQAERAMKQGEEEETEEQATNAERQAAWRAEQRET